MDCFQQDLFAGVAQGWPGWVPFTSLLKDLLKRSSEGRWKALAWVSSPAREEERSQGQGCSKQAQVLGKGAEGVAGRETLQTMQKLLVVGQTCGGTKPRSFTDAFVVRAVRFPVVS